jgi:hypothetical protein
MIAASAVGLFVIPTLYVIFQSLREWTSAQLGSGAMAGPGSLTGRLTGAVGGLAARLRRRAKERPGVP